MKFFAWLILGMCWAERPDGPRLARRFSGLWSSSVVTPHWGPGSATFNGLSGPWLAMDNASSEPGSRSVDNLQTCFGNNLRKRQMWDNERAHSRPVDDVWEMRKSRGTSRATRRVGRCGDDLAHRASWMGPGQSHLKRTRGCGQPGDVNKDPGAGRPRHLDLDSCLRASQKWGSMPPRSRFLLGPPFQRRIGMEAQSVLKLGCMQEGGRGRASGLGGSTEFVPAIRCELGHAVWTPAMTQGC